MTIVEQIGIKNLEDFVKGAKDLGISYVGAEIPMEIQNSVILIVEQYIEEYLNKEGLKNG